MADRIALVVDDEPANLNFLERLIEQAKFSVRGATGGKAALDKVEDCKELALALVDMQLPDMTGLQLISELRKRFPDAYLVIATMHDERDLMEKAFSRGCDMFLVKPHGFMELFRRLISPEELRSGGYQVIDQYGPRPFVMETPKTADEAAPAVPES